VGLRGKEGWCVLGAPSRAFVLEEWNFRRDVTRLIDLFQTCLGATSDGIQ
jgi:hypothetical protein